MLLETLVDAAYGCLMLILSHCSGQNEWHGVAVLFPMAVALHQPVTALGGSLGGLPLHHAPL